MHPYRVIKHVCSPTVGRRLGGLEVGVILPATVTRVAYLNLRKSEGAKEQTCRKGRKVGLLHRQGFTTLFRALSESCGRVLGDRIGRERYYILMR